MIESEKFLQQEGISTQAQNILVPVPDSELEEKWHFAFADGNLQEGFVLEWTPKGENIEDWSKLIQIQYLPLAENLKNKINAELFVNHYIQALKNTSGSTIATILSKTPNRVLLEWRLPEPVKNEKAQHEVVLVITHKNALYRVAFTVKEPLMKEEEKSQWLEILKSTTLS
jgi:hypothetical protein